MSKKLVKKYPSKFYPIDYITYTKDGKLPESVAPSMKKTKEKGFTILTLTPDSYIVPAEIKAYHAGFKHMKEITMPKIQSIRENIKGFFIAEGDLDIKGNYDFATFRKNIPKTPMWLGYKKKLSNYIVGNFLIYFPIKSLDALQKLFDEQKRLVYSDRFFSKLYFSGFLKLADKSIAGELVHYSNVKGGIRY
tara:strand:+ start:910 stop:1485 length:576 start_codon:yes stop_codon:yes gene_type:complete